MSDQKMSSEERIVYLEMQMAELTGKTPATPRPKAIPDFDYKKDHGVDHFNEVAPETIVSGLNEGAKRLIPNRVILLPTKENPHHKQGEFFECDSKLAEEFIKKGFATHVRTKAKHDKIEAVKTKAKK